MNNSKKNTVKCQVCEQDIDTSKERIYKAMPDENGKEVLKICETDWKKNSEQYLEKYSTIYSFYTGEEVNGLEFIKIKGKCRVCKKSFLVKEKDLNESIVIEDLCHACSAETNEKPTKTEQQLATEENKNQQGVSGGVIILIILTVASILGGIVYYSWTKSKNK